MSWLRRQVVTAAQFAAFTTLIVHLEQCSAPLAESDLSRTQYLRTLQCVVWGVLALYYLSNPTILQRLQRLFFEYGWRYPVGRSCELRTHSRWYWSSRHTTPKGLKELARKLRDLLSEEDLKRRILLHLYQVLIKAEHYSVIMDVKPFGSEHDAVLIRGACQYGKTLEAVRLAWLVWWLGEIEENDGIGHCVSYIFTMNTGTKQSKSTFASKIQELFNNRIDKEITDNFPIASPALRESFHLHCSTAYPEKAPTQAHVVLKACNPSGSLAVKHKEMRRMVQHGCITAPTDQPMEDSSTDNADISNLKCYLIYDEDDVNMQGKNNQGQLFKTEDGRNQLCNVMEIHLEQPIMPSAAAAAAGVGPTANDDEDDDDDGTDSAAEDMAVLGGITTVHVRVMGWASITATPEGLIGSESQLGIRWQAHNMLDKGVNPSYYGYDKRVPDIRRVEWQVVKEDWKLPRPRPQPRAPRQHAQPGTGARKTIKKKRATRKQYHTTRAGMKEMLEATLGDRTRARRILLYSSLQPTVRSGDGSIEETQSFVMMEAERMGASALVMTYCGGPTSQECEKQLNGWSYSCVLRTSEDIRAHVVDWFRGPHGGCGCGKCGHCVVAKCRVNVTDDGKAYFARGTLASDLCSILQSVKMAVAAATANPGAAGGILPHVVIVTGRMANRGVSFRSYDGSFYLSDQYVAYVPERTGSNTTVYLKQLFGRICVCLDSPPDGPLRMWTSAPVKDDFDKLVANGDAIWDGLQEGVPVAETLTSVPMFRTQGRGAERPRLHKPAVERHLRLTGGSTMRHGHGVYALLNTKVEHAPLGAATAELCTPAFVVSVLERSIVDAVSRFVSDTQCVRVRILSKVHRVHVPMRVGDLDWRINNNAIKAWLADRHPDKHSIAPNSEAHERFNSWAPTRPAMMPGHWPDLWWQVEDAAQRRIVIIEHTKGYEEARKHTHARTVDVFHRFRMHASEPHMVEIIAHFRSDQVVEQPDARIQMAMQQ